MALAVTAKFGKMLIELGTPTGTDPVAVSITAISNSNPAKVTVAVGDITKFQPGMAVIVSGVVAAGFTGANGTWTAGVIGSPANTITLLGCNMSANGAPAASGGTIDAPKSLVYAAPCGFTSKGVTISKNLQEISIPDCTDPDAPSWVARDVSSMSCVITGDGVAHATDVPTWDDAAMSTSSVPMRVSIIFGAGYGTKTILGNFHVDSEAFGAELGGRVTLAVNATSDGPVTAIWTATP